MQYNILSTQIICFSCEYKYYFLGSAFSQKFSQLNIKEPRTSSKDVNPLDFPNLNSHFVDVPKNESETQSGVMPGWTLRMPTLILHPEHFSINDSPRNFVKEQIDKAGKDPDDNKNKSNGR